MRPTENKKKFESTTDALSYLYSFTRNTSTFRFRGQANSAWSIKPSVYRYCDFERYQTVQHENLMLQSKPKNPIPPLMHTSFDLEWLMLCQHYDIPTRLLDWTTDILVALFFACYNKNEINKNGALFICDQMDYPAFAAYNTPNMKSEELSFISTAIINPRMRMQSGSFMLWGHVPLNDESTETYDLFEYIRTIDNPSIFLKRIIIPAQKKERILAELSEIYGINCSSLYIENGYLEKKYKHNFPSLKEDIRLATLYTTDADRLNLEEERKARSLFKIECRNMIGGCRRLNQIN